MRFIDEEEWDAADYWYDVMVDRQLEEAYRQRHAMKEGLKVDECLDLLGESERAEL